MEGSSAVPHHHRHGGRPPHLPATPPTAYPRWPPLRLLTAAAAGLPRCKVVPPPPPRPWPPPPSASARRRGTSFGAESGHPKPPRRRIRPSRASSLPERRRNRRGHCHGDEGDISSARTVATAHLLRCRGDWWRAPPSLGLLWVSCGPAGGPFFFLFCQKRISGDHVHANATSERPFCVMHVLKRTRH